MLEVGKYKGKNKIEKGEGARRLENLKAALWCLDGTEWLNEVKC